MKSCICIKNNEEKQSERSFIDYTKVKKPRSSIHDLKIVLVENDEPEVADELEQDCLKVGQNIGHLTNESKKRVSDVSSASKGIKFTDFMGENSFFDCSTTSQSRNNEIFLKFNSVEEKDCKANIPKTISIQKGIASIKKPATNSLERDKKSG